MELPQVDYPLSDRLAMPPHARWSEQAANFVSILFCPPLMLVAAVAFIAAHLPHPESQSLARWYAAFILLTPMLFIVWLKRQGWVSDFDLSVRRERVLPMFIAWLGLLVGWLALRAADAPRLLLAFALLQICQGAIFLLITLFWKISLHTTTVSSLTALWWVMTGSVVFLWLGLPLVVLVAWARLRLRRHTAAQAIAGTLLGVLACLIVWQFYGV